ncbi:MAG: hypothetical protein HGA43_04045 [Nitrospirae bacterium]|nr:hypothetical protein [Nitrospirota bacterium]
MRTSAKVIAFLLLVVLSVVSLAACSKSAKGPSDEDAIKAIQSAIEGDPKGLTLKSPITILERGAPVAGDWPFKVEYMVAAKDGSTKKETITYNLTPSLNDMGAPIFLVTVKK